MFNCVTGTILIGALGSCISVCGQAPPHFRFAEPQGSYQVGLHVVELIDNSRTYGYDSDALGKPIYFERGRPLQTLIWYPSMSGGGPRMTVANYGDLLKSETRFEKPRMPVDYEQWINGMSATLSNPLWAIRNAKEEQGRFPVVVYAPSYSSMSWENADLCEFLASHGYVVLASPSMGVNTRDMTTDLPGVRAQAQDISFLIGYADSLPNADPSRVAVAGFSWGGLSNLFAAARDTRIRALVALDGSMRYFPGLVRQSGDVHPDEMTIPLLFFTQGEISPEQRSQFFREPDEYSGPNVLNEWVHGDLVIVHMLGLVHAEFSSMYQRNEDIWKEFPDLQKADYGRGDGILGYALVARYTLRFLDAILKQDQAAAVLLREGEIDKAVPSHFLTVKYRPAEGEPATFESFRLELGRRGFTAAPEVYAEFKKKQPTFRLDKTALAAWVYELQTDGYFKEAIELLKIPALENPSSSDALDNLADAYKRSGELALAKDTYTKAVSINPSDSNAKEQLRKLPPN